MKINDSIFYVGVNDREIDLFESIYKVPEGISYNSYVITDEKIAVMDTVEKRFGDEWLRNVDGVLNGRMPDYLVILHVEPDHSSNIVSFTDKYPDVTVVASAKAFDMIKAFFGRDFSAKRIVVSEGSSLSLGKHTLRFVTAPMVHWPEVVLTYEETTKTLFSADAFGKFGDLSAKDDWVSEARRYYIGIVGKYGAQVQALLKKAAALDIERICPLHGPVLTENLGYYIEKYLTWSSYRPEEEGTVICYASIYGNTREAALLLSEELSALGETVCVYDLARCDMTEAVSDAFRFSKLVLASPTYNADLFPAVGEFIRKLNLRQYQSRMVGIIENGTWAPMAAKLVKGLFEGAKNITFAENTVTVRSALSDESKEQIKKLAKELKK